MDESYRAEFEIVETGQHFEGTVVPVELKGYKHVDRNGRNHDEFPRTIASIHADIDVPIPLDEPFKGIASIKEKMPDGTTKEYRVYNGNSDRHLMQV